ncbi:LysR family transcriptional regulator [Ectothiorhodospira marina]|uniref:DNA-binding transcriptional regulator, LysR family n=1 Tax=Ectothiorhodospira marina TaxID=1396821 RepID=A0A1H7QC84_9GAMM|nr:LysR family transcriptional regulator [Ectothiorhodospira marina]SEL45582.1 DNA-binding transcriptional regulator, LysR family [Ectothiorhodospira marina]
MSDYEALRALLALRNHGQLTAAAQALNRPKSTLSRRLASLEEELGLRLTRQEGGKLRLSPIGHCYAEYGQRILDMAAEAREAATTLSRGTKHRLRVSVSHEMAWGWATWVLNDFLTSHPHCSLEIHALLPGTSPSPREADLCLTCNPVETPELTRRYLGRWFNGVYTSGVPERRCCVPHEPDQIAQCAWIELTGGDADINLQHKVSQDMARVTPRARLTVNTIQTLADGIAKGYGVGILPRWVAECPRHGVMRGRLSRILPDWEPRPTDLHILFRPGLKTPAVDDLIQHITNHLPSRWRLSATPETH